MCGVEFAAGENEKNVNQLKGTALGITIKRARIERHNGGLSFGKVAAHLLAMDMGQGQCCQAKVFQHFPVAKEPSPMVR